MIHRRPSRHISKKSIFAAVRSIPRVGQGRVELPDDFDDPPSYGAVIESLGLNWANNKDLPPPDVTPEIARHLGYSHHDTEIHDVRALGDDVTIQFNHFDIERLAAVIVNYSPTWHKLTRAFPITLRFCGVAELHWLETVENGVLQKITHSFGRINEALDGLNFIYLYRASADQLGVVVVPYRHNWYKRKGWGKLVCDAQDLTTAICIAFTDVSVESPVREQWSEVFGEDALFILDRFLPHWPEETNTWNVDNFKEWLKAEFVGDEKVRLERAREHCLRWMA